MGGKSKPSSSTTSDTSGTSSGTSTQELPPWLTGAAQQAVGTAQTLSQDPTLFNQYQGQQVADVAPGTQQSWNTILGSNPAQMGGQVGQATSGIYNTIAGMGLPQAQQYLQGGIQDATGSVYTGINNANSLLGPWVNAAPTAQQIAQNAQSMMTPYTQAVIDPTMALGKQALQQQLQTVGAQANQAGAFGGARQGVQEGVAQAQSALQESNVLGNLLNTGYGQALGVAGTMGQQYAQNAYNAANQLAQMQYGGNNALAQMQNAAGGTLAGYGQQDITDALQTGSTIPQQYLSNLSGVGQQQQSQQQALLNAQMGNYYGGQQQPIQNLDVLLAALGGVPYGTTTTQNMTNTGTGANAVQNQKNVIGGVLSGAATGAAIGSIVPGVGTAIGAVGGGLLGALG